MRKLLKRGLAFAIVFCALLCFASCSSTDKLYADEFTSSVENGVSESSNSYQTDAESIDNKGEPSEAAVQSNRKIIERINLTVQTKEFDTFIDKINAEIDAAGGYVENSDISGNNYESYSARTADITARIPSSGSGKFTDFITQNGNVTRSEISTEDVTLKYVDTESRIQALTLEKEALERLLESASSVESILTVQNKLTDVIYELDSYKSQLKTYDNLVDYTTVTMRIYEVERTTAVKEQSVWQEIGTNISENFSDIGTFFVRLFVLTVSALPYLVVVGIITLIIVLIVKYSVKRGKIKRSKQIQMTFQNAPTPRPEMTDSSQNQSQNK